MADYSKGIDTGLLRSPITIYTRVQTPSSDGFSIVEVDNDPVFTAAHIEATGPVVFYGSISAGDLYVTTHRIWLRWLPFVDKTHKITRELQTPDAQTRTEIFRVVRVLECSEDLQVIQIDATLENVLYS